MARILGLSFSGHGTGACLVEDGRVVRAVNLERITRRKASLVTLPGHREFLQKIRAANTGLYDTFYFDFYEVFPDLLEYITGARTIDKANLDLVVKTPDMIRRFRAKGDPDYDAFLEVFGNTPVHDTLEHHLCHAYQAYLCSPFEETAILTADGRGEDLKRLGGVALSTTLCVGQNNRVRVFNEIPAALGWSLGGIYANHTRHLGFRPGQEGNTMALASFGEDEYWQQLKELILLHEKGNIMFGAGTFNFLVEHNLEQIWPQLMQDYCLPRQRDESIEHKHMNLAYGVQKATETCLIHAARNLAERTGMKHLAMAGGVMLNCVANTRILEETPFEEIYIMPNAGDRGLAAGAAMYGYHVLLGHDNRQPPTHDYLGKVYSEQEIDDAIAATPDVSVRVCEDIAAEAAELIANGWIIGWHQGGSEFGPRALGHRSILADPRTSKSKERIDHEIKCREWFRPYAPSVLAEYADEYFEMVGDSPYMLKAVQTREEKKTVVPGIVHVDGSARVQCVKKDVEPLYYRLISQFHQRTGVPMLLNTSFNGYDEPVVETPEDALKALKPMKLDAVVIGNRLVTPA